MKARAYLYQDQELKEFLDLVYRIPESVKVHVAQSYIRQCERLFHIALIEWRQIHGADHTLESSSILSSQLKAWKDEKQKSYDAYCTKLENLQKTEIGQKQMAIPLSGKRLR